jgi:hypothetical protein
MSFGRAETRRMVVVDPVAGEVTHLVVEPEHRQGLGRLVPLALVEVRADGVRLGCTLAEFGRLELAEETRCRAAAVPAGRTDESGRLAESHAGNVHH